jgi:hypothetical protein
MTEGFLYKAAMLAVYTPFYLVTKSPKQGAQTTLYVATSDNVNDSNSGEYWADCRILRGKNKYQHDKTVEDNLIAVSKQLVGKWL